MNQTHLGFVGVGMMGGHMVRRLIAAGYDVTIYDTSKLAMEALVAQGALAATSPAGVADTAEIVITSLPTPPIVEAVALGPNGVAGGKRVRIFVDMSTTGSIWATRISDGLVAKGITHIDAPVSGGPGGAAKGTLAIMISGPEEVYPKLAPVLSHLGKLFFVGTKPGLGQTMKLINNLLSAAAMTASAEAIVMGTKAGLDPQQMVDVINAGSGRNSATQDKIPRCVIPRTFDFGFALALQNKDVKLCLEEADTLGVPMIVGSAVRQLLLITAAMEGHKADMTDVVRSVERWAGITVGGRERIIATDNS